MALTYSPLKDTLCIESAMAQSAHLLDLAARVAVESRDFDGLMKVAQGWAELTKGLCTEHEIKGKPVDNDRGQKVGF